MMKSILPYILGSSQRKHLAITLHRTQDVAYLLKWFVFTSSYLIWGFIVHWTKTCQHNKLLGNMILWNQFTGFDEHFKGYILAWANTFSIHRRPLDPKGDAGCSHVYPWRNQGTMSVIPPHTMPSTIPDRFSQHDFLFSSNISKFLIQLLTKGIKSYLMQHFSMAF
jgi:hypothetical protein